MDGQKATTDGRRSAGGAGALSWALCVATLDRIEILEACLRCVLSQTRRPSEIVIVDASAAWRAHAQRARSIVDGSVPLVYVAARRPSLTVQRNQALELARSDILFLIDDDSLMHPDCAASILAVYESDGEGAIAAVADPAHQPAAFTGPFGRFDEGHPLDDRKDTDGNEFEIVKQHLPLSGRHRLGAEFIDPGSDGHTRHFRNVQVVENQFFAVPASVADVFRRDLVPDPAHGRIFAVPRPDGNDAQRKVGFDPGILRGNALDGFVPEAETPAADTPEPVLEERGAGPVRPQARRIPARMGLPGQPGAVSPTRRPRPSGVPVLEAEVDTDRLRLPGPETDGTRTHQDRNRHTRPHDTGKPHW